MNPLLVALALAPGAPALKDKPAALDLTGEWEVTGYVLSGKEAPPGVRIRFAPDGSATVADPATGRGIVGTYTFDPHRAPAEVDIGFRAVAGQPPTRPLAGIVRPDGDGLVLSFSKSGTRPTRFESPAGSDGGLLTLKRVKTKD